MSQQPQVAVLYWPEQIVEVAALAAASKPRLLLVAPEADPPRSTDYLEEWIRLPADERDVAARLDLLATRAAQSGPRPWIDRSDRLFYREDWVALSPIEARLASALVENFEQVVHESELGRRGWPDDEWPGASLRVHLTRLRHKLEPLGLEIPSVRRHGVLLQPSRSTERSPPGGESPSRPQVPADSSPNGSTSR